MANFGHIPYGQSLVGPLHFNASNEDGCDSELDFANDMMEEEWESYQGGSVTPFFLVKHNWDCSYVWQTRNVQKHGGAMALIISDRDNVNLTEAILGDDGTGGGIRIPAVMMTKEDGNIIIDWLT
jgi:hypothetical protein